MDPCDNPLHPAARLGLELFNKGEYYRAHEELETAWRDEKGDVRIVYQAILQVGLVFLYIGIKNYLGTIQLGEKALAKLDKWQGTCQGIDLTAVRAGFIRVLEEAQRLGPDNLEKFDTSLFFKIDFRE